jgi:hypothetical protein
VPNASVYLDAEVAPCSVGEAAVATTRESAKSSTITRRGSPAESPVRTNVIERISSYRFVPTMDISVFTAGFPTARTATFDPYG